MEEMNTRRPDITPAELAELRRLSEEAAPGPWEFEPDSSGLPYNLQVPNRCKSGRPLHALVLLKCARGWAPHEADAALISAARNALPRLLDEIERLRAEMDRLRGQAANQVLRLLDEIGELQANAAKWRELGPWYAIKDDRVPSPTGFVDSRAGVPWVSNSREQMRGGCLLPVSGIVEYTGAENQ